MQCAVKHYLLNELREILRSLLLYFTSMLHTKKSLGEYSIAFRRQEMPEAKLRVQP